MVGGDNASRGRSLAYFCQPPEGDIHSSTQGWLSPTIELYQTKERPRVVRLKECERRRLKEREKDFPKRESEKGRVNSLYSLESYFLLSGWKLVEGEFFFKNARSQKAEAGICVNSALRVWKASEFRMPGCGRSTRLAGTWMCWHSVAHPVFLWLYLSL